MTAEQGKTPQGSAGMYHSAPQRLWSKHRPMMEQARTALLTAIASLGGGGKDGKDGNGPWRCFHCHEIFTDARDAAIHFGPSMYGSAACQIDAEKFREMESYVARYRDEDSDLHREIHRLRAEHYVALRREEEKGYARAVRDCGQDVVRLEALEVLADAEISRCEGAWEISVAEPTPGGSTHIVGRGKTLRAAVDQAIAAEMGSK